jgi:uncharacterized membrane protein YhhN
MTFYLVALLLLGCATEAAFIMQEHKQHLLAALLLKAAASLFFVFAGFVAFSLTTLPVFGRMVVLGLMLGAIGDVCLNLRFLLVGHAKVIFPFGIGSFLLGHIFYLIALIGLDPTALLLAAPVAAIVSYAMIRFILARVEVSGANKVFGIVFLCVVLLMACASVALFALDVQNPGRAVFAAGALLFAASDVLLVLNQFGKKAYPALRPLNLSLYYLGQVCICLTIALMH